MTTLHDFEGVLDGLWILSFGLSQFHGHGSWLMCEVTLRAALHLEAGPIPLEADCMKCQPFWGWRLASISHYSEILTRGGFSHM
jgi:hypothetical protein